MLLLSLEAKPFRPFFSPSSSYPFPFTLILKPKSGNCPETKCLESSPRQMNDYEGEKPEEASFSHSFNCPPLDIHRGPCLANKRGYLKRSNFKITRTHTHFWINFINLQDCWPNLTLDLLHKGQNCRFYLKIAVKTILLLYYYDRLRLHKNS